MEDATEVVFCGPFSYISLRLYSSVEQSRRHRNTDGIYLLHRITLRDLILQRDEVADGN